MEMHSLLQSDSGGENDTRVNWFLRMKTWDGSLYLCFLTTQEDQLNEKNLPVALHPSSTPKPFSVLAAMLRMEMGPILELMEEIWYLIQLFIEVFKEGVITCLKSHRETEE